MKIAHTKGTDLQVRGRRLDASYHASDGVKAEHWINQWCRRGQANETRPRSATTLHETKISSYRVHEVAPLGKLANLFNGPRFARSYVSDPNHGVLFLSSSDMLLADFRGVKYLSKRNTPKWLLDDIRLSIGWTLISCSGTVGNTVYVRRDMDGMTGSQHIMRVVPNETLIRSGYLYAFLSSEFGKALVTKGTYGAVIRHIEPQHIENLPVPRLNDDTEQRIHELIVRTAHLRAEANELFDQAKQSIHDEVGFSSPKHNTDHAYVTGTSRIDKGFGLRLDSFAYVGYVEEAIKVLQDYGRIENASDVGYRTYNPPLFKRIFAQKGHPYMSGVELYTLHPKTDRYLSQRLPNVNEYLIDESMVLVQGAGQRYGLITTPMMVTKGLSGVAATSDIVRIVHQDRNENGYMCALLASDFGRRLALRYTYGTSIPRLNVHAFGNFRIPWPERHVRLSIGNSVVLAYDKRDEANQLEDQAQALLSKSLGD